MGWLREAVHAPDKGNTEWTLVLTTGHFGRDPQLAQATREAAISMLTAAGSSGDTVRVVAAEMKPWRTSSPAPISDLDGLLPTAPAEGSRGGCDIEALLAELAPSAKGPIVVLSAGDSQVPLGGGTLKGGDGSVPGYDRPKIARLPLPTRAGPRTIRVTLLTKDGLFTGQEKREPLPAAPSTPEPEIPIAAGSATPVQVSGVTWPFVVVIGLLALIAGLLAGRVRRPLPPIHHEPHIPHTGDAAELEGWKAEAKALQRRLDLIAQDLTAAAEHAGTLREEEKIELRQEITRREKALDVWDETAMDFLDGVDRALEHPDLSPERRQAWERIASQFTRLAVRAGFDVVAPAPGDPVLDGQHRIERVVPSSPATPAGSVAVLIARGYRRGDRILRPARIEMAED